MFSSQSAEHPIKLPCRRISALVGDTQAHRFLAGTCFLPNNNSSSNNNDNNVNGALPQPKTNQIHSVRFHEDVNELGLDAIYSHPTGEVLVLSPSPYDSNIALTCGGGDGVKDDASTVLWRMPPVDPAAHQQSQGTRFGDEDEYDDEAENPAAGGEDEVSSLEEVARLPSSDNSSSFADGSSGRISCALWNPNQDGHIVTIDSTTLRSWDIVDDSDIREAGTAVISPLGERAMLSGGGASWDPHHPDVVGAVCGRNVTTWDLRSMERSHILKDTHSYATKDMDFNPNRPHVITTGGEDGLVKFWDVRKSSGPLKILKGHSHWVSTVKYNRFHDQLILSGGSDSLVNLWRVSSISSAPLLELENDDGTDSADAADVRVSKFENQESVYDVAWSACDAWVYCSLSYDGQLVLNHVPSKEKYKILL